MMTFQRASELIWFESGIENANRPEEKKIRSDLMLKGLSEPKYDICFLYGTSTETVNRYYNTIRKHINNIDGLFFPFSNKRKTYEAQALNDLGIAEKIFFSPAEYINMNSYEAPNSYKDALNELCDKIEEADTGVYGRIREENNKSKNKLQLIEKELLKLYAGFDITKKTEHPAMDWECNACRGSKDGLITLKTFTENNSGFDYANEFLIRHIFEPISRFQKTFDFSDPVYQNFILAKSLTCKNDDIYKVLWGQ